MKNKVVWFIIAALIITGGAFAGWQLARNRGTPITKPAGSQNQASQGPQNSSAYGNNGQVTPKTHAVLVYFSKHPDSDNDPSITFPVHRTSPDSGMAKFAITELLNGPTPAETASGYFTTARLRSGTAASDFTININNGVATLQFLKPFDHLGVVADGQADSELKATLKQFNTVQKVIILNYLGNCEFDLSGQNLCKQ